jgi:uncharacterized membrane protein YraQ (UPF0718 family)
MATFLSSFAALTVDSLPFLAFGVVLGHLAQGPAISRSLRKILPRSYPLSLLFFLFAGLCLPLCDCAMVPLARRLRAEGVRKSCAMAFVLAAPIVNPLSLASAALAFQGSPLPIWAIRLAMGLAVATLVSLAIELNPDWREWAPETATAVNGQDDCEAGLCDHGHDHDHDHVHGHDHAHAEEGQEGASPHGFWEFMAHAGDEFLDTARFSLLGIFVASALRALIPQEALASALGTPFAAMGAGAL